MPTPSIAPRHTVCAVSYRTESPPGALDNFRTWPLADEGVNGPNSCSAQLHRRLVLQFCNVSVERVLFVGSGSCVDDARGSRVLLAVSLRSGASHVSGLFARRTWPLALM